MTRPKPQKAARKAIVSLVTAEERAKLPVRKAPYWLPLGALQALGFQKGESGAVWLARVTSPRKQEVIGVPEEQPERPGYPALTCAQAMIVAGAWCQATLNPPPPVAPVIRLAGSTDNPEDPTIGDALDQHLHVLETNQVEWLGTSRSRIGKIKRELGHIRLRDLIMLNITDWLAYMVATPPARRSKKDGAPKYAPNWDPSDYTNKRRRQSTANRCLADLKAALNRALDNHWVASDQAWVKVKAFPDATTSRDDVLDAQQQSAFLDACTPEFRPLAYMALLTGMRYGPLTRWKVKDFRPGVHSIRAGWDKKHARDRLMPLTDEAITALYFITKGRDPEEFIFLKANGKPWGRNHQLRPMAEARKALNMKISFYTLRHTAITTWIMAGIDAEVVASAVGTSTKMIEDHYKNPRSENLAFAINNKAPRIRASDAEVDSVSKMYEKERLEREQIAMEPSFTLESLHLSQYLGKLQGGLVEAPPPKRKPTREELQNLVKEIPVSKIAVMFETSGVTVRKWCLNHDILVPTRGEWAHRRSEERQAANRAAMGFPPRRPMPSKEELEDLIWKMPATEIAKQYGVNGPTVLKWAVRMGIPCPGRGHWSKRDGKAYQERKKSLEKAARRKVKKVIVEVDESSA